MRCFCTPASIVPHAYEVHRPVCFPSFCLKTDPIQTRDTQTNLETDGSGMEAFFCDLCFGHGGTLPMTMQPQGELVDMEIPFWR